MIQPKIRTEYHFNSAEKVYAKLDKVATRLAELGCTCAAIMDCTTYGHIAWHQAMEKVNVNPLLGAEYVCPDGEKVGLIALSDTGLRDLYRVMSDRESNPYPFSAIADMPDTLAKLMITPGSGSGWRNGFAVVDPVDPRIVAERLRSGLPPLVCSDNWYILASDRAAFQMIGGAIRADPRQPQHILSETELTALSARFDLKPAGKSQKTRKGLARIVPNDLSAVRTSLPTAENLAIKGSLLKLARKGIDLRGLRKGWNPTYEARLRREIGMIEEKGFESYLLLLADTVSYAKKHMLVGPARGSAAGSLVCYLTGITDIDPIPHGLLFERFIDVTRKDLPDIDMDFPDSKREMVIEYLRRKYGAENVARLGTIQTWQPRSILTEIGKRMNIPMWELSNLKNAMIERSSGDARFALCLQDTLETVDVGRHTVAKYPSLRRVTDFESHAKYSGTHAAGVLVCSSPIRHFATVQADGTAQLDKKDAEVINLLKLDLLGLRTLTVLEDAIGKKKIDLLKIPLDDPDTFALLNSANFAGIFQFEGNAVQMLAKKMDGHIDRFSDISALGALARPGPLSSGGAMSFVARRIGKERIEHLHPKIEPYTSETYGIIIYQEQVMQISKEIGDMSWDDVTALRRIMSKSMGEEIFNKYFPKFKEGARKKGINDKQALHIWNHMNTMGSWAFNKSHSVSYGLLSYWCAWMKAHHLLDFAAATLRHARDDDQSIMFLRELKTKGIDYVAFDAEKSDVNWTVKNGRLIGGFLNLKGVGESKAQKLIETRGQWTEKQAQFVREADVLFSEVSPCESRYGHIYDDPREAGFRIRRISRIAEITEDTQRIAIIARLKVKNLRDLNEYMFQVKRKQEGKDPLLSGVPTQYLNLVMEDDTGQLYCGINTRDFEEVGRDILNNGVAEKSYYIMQGFRNRIGRINITWAKQLD